MILVSGCEVVFNELQVSKRVASLLNSFKGGLDVDKIYSKIWSNVECNSKL